MKCIHCGALLDSNAKFCTKCGSKIEFVPVAEFEPEFTAADVPAPAFEQPAYEEPTYEQPAYEQPAYEQPAQEAPKKGFTFDVAAVGHKLGGLKLSKKQLVGLCVGTLFIIIGLIRVLTAGTTLSSTSFGADFYTYTYRGIVAISNLLASIEVSLGWLIAAVGAAIDVISLRD